MAVLELWLFKRKGSSKKIYIAVFLLIVLIAATGAIVYSYIWGRESIC